MSAELSALRAQAEELCALVDELGDEDFERPSRCPGWRVAELVAHCEGMMIRLARASGDEAGGPPEGDRADYYRYDPAAPREDDPSRAFSEAVRERVRGEVGGREPDALRTGLRAAAGEMLHAVDAIPGDRVVKRPGHPALRFDEFVATRVLEFGVHTMDIGHATLRGERIHPQAVAVVRDILERLLGAPLPPGLGWDDRTFILTGTGRRRLEPNERYVLGELASKFPLLQ